MSGTEPLPAARISLEVIAGPHIPFHPHGGLAQIDHLNMDARLPRHHIRGGAEMGDAMLPFHRVVGLTAVDPVAIHADAHAARGPFTSHCVG